MIDVHCHLNFQAFEKDVDVVIKRAFAKGVTKIVNVGTKLDSSRAAVDLADKYENLYAIVGVHPHHADKITLESDWLKELEEIAKHAKVLGIGEIGMDYYSYSSNGIVNPKLQRETFEAQIELAHRLGLPLQIHHRQVGQELIDILSQHKNLLQTIPGMFHCFAGSKDFLKQALNLGFYIGFDGNSTYPGLAKGETTELKEIVKYTPLDRILVETDSPYLAPIPHRGERNEPGYVIITGQFLAELKEVPFENLLEETSKNVYTVFSRINRNKL